MLYFIVWVALSWIPEPSLIQSFQKLCQNTLTVFGKFYYLIFCKEIQQRITVFYAVIQQTSLLFAGSELHWLFSTTLLKTKTFCCSSFPVKKFKRRMTHDTLYLHHKINQYFGTHLSLSAYIIPKSAKPHKQKLLKAISTENFTLPHIPPELR